MKVHPSPKKRNITLWYDSASNLSEANVLPGRQKKLRRIPHLFAKVLQLPFHSDADVVVKETSDCFRFIVDVDADAEDVGGGAIRAQTIEICPGVTKIVIRGNSLLDSLADQWQLDMWRFRLPEETRPELASASYDDGKLIVTVPKGANLDWFGC